MIDPTTLLLFLAAAWAMILTPGPDILYVLTRGVAGGRRAGFVSGLGVGSGEVLHTVLVVFGLAAVLSASLTAFLIIKYLGTLYLLYLGVKTLRDKQAFALAASQRPQSLTSVYWQGLLTNLLNPKAVLFYVAFLPQFVNPEHGSPQVQIVAFGLLFAFSDILFLSLLAYTTDHLHRWFTRQPRFMAQLRWITGSILIGLGIRLAVMKRE